MADESMLSDDFLHQLMNVGEVDILIGVPTFNDAATVAQTVQSIRAGLLKYFPRQRAVIINVDGGSRDSTQDLVRAASISDLNHITNLGALRTLHCIGTTREGAGRDGAGLHTILAAADLMHASACAIISPDSTSIEPEWIDRLLRPVTRDNFDLVTPVYRRHKFDGLLVRNLIYPMTRALYCKPVREPHPSEFAFSGRLACNFLEQDIWSQPALHNGAETYMVVSAISNGYRWTQSFLGLRTRAETASGDLVLAMRQTVAVLFWSLEKNFPVCAVNPETEAALVPAAEPDLSIEPISVNSKRLHQMFVRGVSELGPVLASILSAETLAQLNQIAQAPEDLFATAMNCGFAAYMNLPPRIIARL